MKQIIKHDAKHPPILIDKIRKQTDNKALVQNVKYKLVILYEKIKSIILLIIHMVESVDLFT